MSSPEELRLSSHVGRDLLAAAASFNDEATVVWEYVVNSLQYVEKGVKPTIQVEVRPRKKGIEIRDNGRGMSREDLKRFFTMHAENLDRRRGRLGRGKFGTGKSAAFGIARSLTVESSHGGLRNVARLDRSAVDSSAGGEIPVEWTVRDEPTTAPTGTTILIGEVILQRRIEQEKIIRYIEKHLQAFRAVSPMVAVGHHVCSFRELSFTREKRFRPSARQSILGDAELLVRVSASPLDPSDRGIVVTAGPGATVAQEDGGICAKEMGSYLFGEIDLPALENSDSPLEPYDPTRRLRLNPAHPVAQAAVIFIGQRLDEVRRELLDELRQEKKSRDARRLAAEAKKIADVINSDFLDWQGRLDQIRAATAGKGPAAARHGGDGVGGDDASDWVEGEQRPGFVEASEGGDAEGSAQGRPAPSIPRSGDADDQGDAAVDPAGGAEHRRKRPSSSFRVDYRRLGQDEPDRSRYDAEALTILINLDHPTVRAALDDEGVGGIAFQRLSYEIAFVEYAFALEYHALEQDPDLPASDALYDVRDTVHRVSRAAAALYRST